LEDSKTSKAQPVVVDAQGHIAGRLSSHIAKLLLNGNRVFVVNAEKALVSGHRKSVVNNWLKKLEISSVVNPKYGPFHPRRPERILKRMVRGMIPRRKPKGLEAIRRLRVYTGLPEEFEATSKITFQDSLARKPLPYYITVGEIASVQGWKGK